MEERDHIHAVSIPDLSTMSGEELDAHADQVWEKVVAAMKKHT